MKKKSSQKRTLFSSTCFLTIVLWIAAALVAALELFGLHHRIGLTDLPLWNTLISPFAQNVKDNFLNLFISQISTTFLVTAFLSLLGDKDSAIYWTSAMDHKLVHPKGSSLKDFTWYSICTLAISFLAAFLQARLCFILSFLANIFLLGIITWRMIVAFYSRDSIKKELKAIFMQLPEEQQQACLSTMEENTIRAAHDHNVEFLRECKEFFEDFITDDDIKKLQSDEQEIRTYFLDLDEVFTNCNSLLRNDSLSLNRYNQLGQTAAQEGKQFALALKDKLIQMYKKSKIDMPISTNKFDQVPGFVPSTSIEEATNQIGAFAHNIDQLLWVAENPLWIRYVIEKTKKINDSIVQTGVLRFLHNVPPQFPELTFSCIQTIFRGMGLSDLIECSESERKKRLELRLKNSISSSRLTYTCSFHISSLIKERILYVLHANIQTLPESIFTQGLDMLAVLNLNSLIDYFNLEAKWYLDKNCDEPIDFSGFLSEPLALMEKTHNNHQPLDAPAKAIISLCALIKDALRHVYNIKCAEDGLPPVSDLPKEVSNRVLFFSKDDIRALLDMVCSKNALFGNISDAHSLLTYLCEYAPKNDKTLVTEIEKTIKDATWLGADRECILIYL